MRIHQGQRRALLPHTLKSPHPTTNWWKHSLAISLLIWYCCDWDQLSITNNNCSASLLPLQNHSFKSNLGISRGSSTGNQNHFTGELLSFLSCSLGTFWNHFWCPSSFRTEDWPPWGCCAGATACSSFSSPATLHHFFDMAGLEGSKKSPVSFVVCTYVAVLYTLQQ